MSFTSTGGQTVESATEICHEKTNHASIRQITAKKVSCLPLTPWVGIEPTTFASRPVSYQLDHRDFPVAGGSSKSLAAGTATI